MKLKTLTISCNIYKSSLCLSGLTILIFSSFPYFQMNEVSSLLYLLPKSILLLSELFLKSILQYINLEDLTFSYDIMLLILLRLLFILLAASYINNMPKFIQPLSYQETSGQFTGFVIETRNAVNIFQYIYFCLYTELPLVYAYE